MQCCLRVRSQEHGSCPQGFEEVVVKGVTGGEKIVLSGFLSFERVERKMLAPSATTDRRSHSVRRHVAAQGVHWFYVQKRQSRAHVGHRLNEKTPGEPGVFRFRRKASVDENVNEFRPPR